MNKQEYTITFLLDEDQAKSFERFVSCRYTDLMRMNLIMDNVSIGMEHLFDDAEVLSVKKRKYQTLYSDEEDLIL